MASKIFFLKIGGREASSGESGGTLMRFDNDKERKLEYFGRNPTTLGLLVSIQPFFKRS